MVKVLVADQNAKQVSDCCQYLSNYDNMLNTIGANTGIDTLTKYNESKADILILNSKFDDMESTEIIDRLSNTNYEKRLNNVILTINSKKDNFEFVNTAKIYKIFYKPISLKVLAESVEEIKEEKNYDSLDENLLNKILFSMKITIGSYQTEILKEIIREAYNYPILLDNFDSLLSIISCKHYGLDPENIRAMIRRMLSSINKSRDSFTNHPVIKMLELNKNITPKNFIEAVVSYLHIQKSKK